MTDLRALWAEIQQLLRGALAEIKLEASANAVAVNYLENNELELALRSIRSAVEERNVTLPTAAAEKLKRAAFLMRVDL